LGERAKGECTGRVLVKKSLNPVAQQGTDLGKQRVEKGHLV